jgi:hypothetical protein
MSCDIPPQGRHYVLKPHSVNRRKTENGVVADDNPEPTRDDLIPEEVRIPISTSPRNGRPLTRQ